MENGLIIGLNNESPVEKKRQLAEDLALVREGIEFFQNKLSEGLTLDSEESEDLQRMIDAEKELAVQFKKADNDLGDIIKELQDGRKKSSDLMDMGKAVAFKEGVSIDNVGFKKAFAREITPRRNKETIERDTEKLFERHGAEIKAKSIYSVNSVFALFYPERVKGNVRKGVSNDNIGKWEKLAIKAGIAKIRGWA